ncbi:vacuolar protein sorting-associated protein VTA1 homolog [Ptychodera flava]|uniref:vacuolar protein sorting-associated protein VTA1 homolog n=1 Tax=Ptychodera flava TaxID=63121 RepID=UPI003969EA68
MAAAKIPAVPAVLKALRHYIDIAKEHDARDPVVSYYCRRYAVEEGMKIDSKSPDSRKFLFAVMDCLEQMKKEFASNEAVHNEVVGQAHLENYALKIFLYADNEDRAARFNKNVVKSFYKASMLFDALQTFGELSEDIKNNRKYARWKAAYIHDCLKKGETPHAGPLDDSEDMFGAAGGAPIVPSNFPSQIQPQNPSIGGSQNNLVIPPGTHAPPTTPQDPGLNRGVIPGPSSQHIPPPVQPTNQQGAVNLTQEDYTTAQKYCRYAGSALQYEDVPTAIENLQKALRLLQTGKE